MAKLRELLGWRLYLLRDRLERDCPACLGRGVAPDDRICPACNGRGWQQWRFGWKPVKERGKGMDDQVANWRARLQAELDALRAQITEGKAEPEATGEIMNDPTPSFLRPLSRWDNQAILDLYRGQDCPVCTESLDCYGMLPSYCDHCGADRSHPGELWDEIYRRDLENTLWHNEEHKQP